MSKDEFDDIVEELIDSGSDKDKIMKVFKKEKDLTNMAEIQDASDASVQRADPRRHQPGYLPQPPKSDYQPLMQVSDCSSFAWCSA